MALISLGLTQPPRPEIREKSYADVIQTALYDAALGGLGKPQPQETSTVLACCRLWSAAASTFTVEPDGPLTFVLPEIGWQLARAGYFAARLDGGQFHTVDRFRRLPSGWYATETTRDELTARTVVAPDAFLLIQLPGGRPPWRSSGAEALAALDRALAVDASKPVGIALGSGLEGALDLSAVTQTLTAAWKESFRQGAVVVSDGRPTAAHTGPSPELLTGASNIRPDLVGTVLDSYGIPRSLFTASGAGTRESLRLFAATTSAWLAALTERAARRVLGGNITVSAMRSSTPADVVSRARAAFSLTQAGVETAEALRLAGLQ